MPIATIVNFDCESKLRLWHIRFAHISKIGLQKLHKKLLLGNIKMNKLSF